MKKSVSFVFTSAIIFFSMECPSGESNCPICIGDSCNVIPQDCQFGTYENECGQMICAKGPGELCGGFNYRYGKCTMGTECMCFKCVGCSSMDYGMTCYNKLQIDCPVLQMNKRVHNILTKRNTYKLFAPDNLIPSHSSQSQSY